MIRVQVKAAENANEERLKVLVLNQVDLKLIVEGIKMQYCANSR